MIISVPLKFAQLCMDCNDLTIMTGGSRCPVCESRAIIPLASILNREPVPKSLPELADFIKIPTKSVIAELMEGLERQL